MNTSGNDAFWKAYWALLDLLDIRETIYAPSGSMGVFEENWHPVFALARHGRGRDNHESGSLLGVRGDCLQIPAWSEHGAVGVFEVGFHKGDMSVGLFVFKGNEKVVEAAVEVASLFETR